MTIIILSVLYVNPLLFVTLKINIYRRRAINICSKTQKFYQDMVAYVKTIFYDSNIPFMHMNLIRIPSNLISVDIPNSVLHNIIVDDENIFILCD